jgi:hypothetical protein
MPLSVSSGARVKYRCRGRMASTWVGLIDDCHRERGGLISICNIEYRA